jgi:alpha-ribazole phosphatase
MSTLIQFIRHGTPVGGNRYRGNAIDDPLSDKGWRQMRDAVKDLPVPDIVISSPMKRCLEFASDYCTTNNLAEPLTDDRLKEIGFGEWEGQTSAEIEAADPEVIRRFYFDPVNQRPAGAEPLDAFCSRVTAALKAIRTQHADKRILVVAHAGVMRAITGIVLETPLASLYKISVGNAAIITLKDDGNRPLTLVID